MDAALVQRARGDEVDPRERILAQSGGRAGGLKLLSVLRDETVIADAREAALDLLRADPELAGLPDLAAAVRRLEDSEQAVYLEKT